DGEGSEAARHRAATAREETVHTTAMHPWLTADRGWVRAGDLRVGDRTVTLGGGVAIVTQVRTVLGTAMTYNLTIGRLHTFAVGGGQYVVHNTCGPTGPSQSPSGGGGGGGGGPPRPPSPTVLNDAGKSPL